MSPSVAHLLAFEELPEETIQLVKVLYEGGRLGSLLSKEEVAQDEDVAVAYQQGWDDAIQEVEWSMPNSPSRADALSALNRKRR
jgi:hypothetical protein